MGRLLSLGALVVLIAACRVGTEAVPTPLPSPTPHAPVAQAVLQQANVPAGLAACPGSGPITTYISSLKSPNPALAQMVDGEWKKLKGAGATEAAISLFAANPAACTAELGASGSTRSAASFVVAFRDQGQADRAWQAGIFGFTPPAPGATAPGIGRGDSTGLGTSSWTYTRSPAQLACWRKGVFVALVVLANLDGASFKAATAAVDAHLN